MGIYQKMEKNKTSTINTEVVKWEMTFARKIKRKKAPKTPRCPKCHKRLTYHVGKGVWMCESSECGYYKVAE